MKKFLILFACTFISNVYGCRDILGSYSIIDIETRKVVGVIQNQAYNEPTRDLTSAFLKFEYFPEHEGINANRKISGKCEGNGKAWGKGDYLYRGSFYQFFTEFDATTLKIGGKPYILRKQ